MTRYLCLLLVATVLACSQVGKEPVIDTKPCDDNADGGIGGTGIECNMREN